MSNDDGACHGPRDRNKCDSRPEDPGRRPSYLSREATSIEVPRVHKKSKQNH